MQLANMVMFHIVLYLQLGTHSNFIFNNSIGCFVSYLIWWHNIDLSFKDPQVAVLLIMTEISIFIKKKICVNTISSPY